jgi:L-alanine-DL-glutamate epimerase-like enolase superfamily enzyme
VAADGLERVHSRIRVLVERKAPVEKPTDIRVVECELRFLPVETRVPLVFGTETLTSVTCARVRVSVVSRSGSRADGYGETPLSVQWAWPSTSSYQSRHQAMLRFCEHLVTDRVDDHDAGHALDVGHDFIERTLVARFGAFNSDRIDRGLEPMPWLAALVAASAFDLAVHDAYGNACSRPVWETYGPDFLGRDLAAFLTPAPDSSVSFFGRFPSHYISSSPRSELPAWHLVGGLDPLDASELSGKEPKDGHPVLLRDWIRKDGLRCLKVKLRGNDSKRDLDRLVRVGEIALDEGVLWLSADFNCTVESPEYVTEVLDRLLFDHPRLFAMLLYVEQPFPYELEEYRLDVRAVSARKPLFMDESAHDWRKVRLGRSLGWTGVALKTCKTQTGALLSLAWARAHGMTLMVQDLTNPMLAQIPHVLLAAYAETIQGVETNAMQFYPDASLPEARVHPGLYRRRHGVVDLSTIHGSGFGYRVSEIQRELPPPVLAARA